ncbi:hypothetical protein NC653_010328 [Populus alba x Populus x berolinensis]|uniref:Uncharacterized protein n=1 Tax=Populus alba x Populus x berolinensis TaxID=444605 RepID=A0AAD6W6A6_9ROSI|nr:hypothetical protein NC653_010328 [Populus alba x Populus x berolinensis]
MEGTKIRRFKGSDLSIQVEFPICHVDAICLLEQILQIRKCVPNSCRVINLHLKDAVEFNLDLHDDLPKILKHLNICMPLSFEIIPPQRELQWWALAFGWQAFDMAYKPFLNKAPSAMDKSVNLLKIPMVMMILLIARRRAPSLNLMLFSLMRTQQDEGRNRRSVLSVVSYSLMGFRYQGFEWVFGCSTMLKF